MSPSVTLEYFAKRTRARLKQTLPPSARQLVRGLVGERLGPPVGKVDFGDLCRTQPVSLNFGFDRGTPIDRYYIERFLAAHALDIRGRALEIGDAAYCKRFGGDRITHQDVLDISPDAAQATIIGDLSESGLLPEGAFDCLVLTQTLHLIYDMGAAVAEMHRALRPGGLVLLSVPGISQLDRGEWGKSWYWSLTQHSARRLFAEVFGPENVEVEAYGNVFAATAFLQGIAVEEVDSARLDCYDEAYPVTLAVRARKV